MYVAQTRHKFDDPRTKPKQSLTELDGRAMWMDGRCGWTGDVDGRAMWIVNILEGAHWVGIWLLILDHSLLLLFIGGSEIYNSRCRQ